MTKHEIKVSVIKSGIILSEDQIPDVKQFIVILEALSDSHLDEQLCALVEKPIVLEGISYDVICITLGE